VSVLLVSQRAAFDQSGEREARENCLVTGSRGWPAPQRSCRRCVIDRSVGANGYSEKDPHELTLERLGVRGSRERPATGWDSVTPTEQRVVAVAAEGLTSRQIAERLYISTFTVGSHLRHVYQKLGINTRVELTAQASRHHPNSE